MAKLETEVGVKVTVSKPGWQTTEFWISVFTAVYIFANGDSPDNELIAGVVAGVYTLGRGYVKGKE